jgi:hypothetical protein
MRRPKPRIFSTGIICTSPTQTILSTLDKAILMMPWRSLRTVVRMRCRLEGNPDMMSHSEGCVPSVSDLDVAIHHDTVYGKCPKRLSTMISQNTSQKYGNLLV